MTARCSSRDATGAPAFASNSLPQQLPQCAQQVSNKLGNSRLDTVIPKLGSGGRLTTRTPCASVIDEETLRLP